MFFNYIPGPGRDGGHESIQVIAFKKSYLTTNLAQEHVLVTLASGYKSLAARRLVNSLDEMQFFQLFKCTVDGNQA